ncbi:MAG: AraC family transcriptional regulator, partial [Verrucomicrobiota bacterium]
MNPAWQETTVDGARTRRWSLDVKQCPDLAEHHIAWLGLDKVYAPYRRVRLAPSGSFLLACQVCLAPPRVLNAFHAVPGRPWVFAWVRYHEPPPLKPLVGAGSPLRINHGTEELGRTLSGLRAEWEGERDPVLTRHWIGLVHGLSRRLARPWRSESRIAELWDAVARDLAADWKLTTLARRCSLSAEHLRRVCRRELGRTPM